MYIYGTVNPDAEAADYKGFYLTEADIDEASKELVGKPVRVEHKKEVVGEVCSAWKSGKKMEAVMRIDDNSIEGTIVQGFIERGTTPELSLGYSVDIQNTADGIQVRNKKMMEVSIVKKGARPNCKIHAKSTNPLTTKPHIFKKVGKVSLLNP